MEWLTAAKIPVGSVANMVFVWMKTHMTAIFDTISWALEGLIACFLWLLQAPNPLVMIALFVALAWVLQRNCKICLGVGYTTDAMDVAVASALILTALGEKGYGELRGHHLSLERIRLALSQG